MCSSAALLPRPVRCDPDQKAAPSSVVGCLQAVEPAKPGAQGRRIRRKAWHSQPSRSHQMKCLTNRIGSRGAGIRNDIEWDIEFRVFESVLDRFLRRVVGDQLTRTRRNGMPCSDSRKCSPRLMPPLVVAMSALAGQARGIHRAHLAKGMNHHARCPVQSPCPRLPPGVWSHASGISPAVWQRAPRNIEQRDRADAIPR